MTPVFQTIVSDTTGNCGQAVLATLFDLPLNAVPHLILLPDDVYWDAYLTFLRKMGYEYSNYAINPNRDDLPDDVKRQYEYFNGELPDFGGVNGLFEATVISNYSTKERIVTHAVICDKNFNIIHDPNPNYNRNYPRQDELGYNGIIGVTLIKKIVK